MRIRFLGATNTVTGSKYLVRFGRSRMLVDCGLFQGYKQLRLRNWSPLPVAPHELDAVILTHAHLDHSGYIPLLVKNGFRGRIFCSAATSDLCSILLPDSGHLMEEEAGYANRHRFSKHDPALPLYTEDDARRCLQHFEPVEFNAPFSITGDICAELLPAGHILGASIVRLRLGDMTITFSGDLGRSHDPIMVPPSIVEKSDYLVVESTYGNRLHPVADPMASLGNIIRQTIHRGGTVLVPSFAVGRAQELLYYIHHLKLSGAIPAMLPVYLDSPMAVDATAFYLQHRREHRLSIEECRAMCSAAKFVNSVEESIALGEQRMPKVIIAASGMATGGRVVHHLKIFAPERVNTILFAGYQAGGTRGASMVGGAEAVKIHGKYVPIRAEVRQISNLSAHADAGEIAAWLSHFKKAPRRTFIVHGEPDAADALRMYMENTLHWPCTVPDYLQAFDFQDAAANLPQ